MLFPLFGQAAHDLAPFEAFPLYKILALRTRRVPGERPESAGAHALLLIKAPGSAHGHAAYPLSPLEEAMQEDGSLEQ